MEVTSRDVTFRHDGVRLAATLYLPAAQGSRPAMILMPGSGPQSRTPLAALARRFASHGLITLVYDKQGVGKSGGDWTRESLDDLADDALAGIRFLRALPHVDAQRVGAWGISQSGWLIARVARKEPALAFAICVTGGGATPREVEEYGYRSRLRHGGFGDTEWRAAWPLVQRYMDYLATGRDRKGLLAAIAAAKGKKWSSALGLSRVIPSTAEREKWAWVATYDPAADIRAMHMPVLVLLGGSDPFSPPDIAFRRWQAGLAGAGNPRDLVVSFPTAGHGIRTNGHDMHARPNYAPGYVTLQLSWLRRNGVLN
ncbi:MAG: CocE/NonD family hydrolase [Rhodanobacteraceae bacterium]